MELKKFKKKIGELTTIEEKWAYFFKHAHQSTLAKKMLEKNKPLDEIIDFTGLAKEDVKIKQVCVLKIYMSFL